MAAPADGGAPCVRLKIITTGSAQTGKSCLVKRYCENKFTLKYAATIGVDYGVRPVSVCGRDARINFFDMSGFDHYAEIRTEFYRDAHGAALVFGLDDRPSFERLGAWLQEARDGGAGTLAWVLCGSKSDLKRAVGPEEAKAWAADHGMPYFEVSASSGENVATAMETLFAAALEHAAVAADTKAKTVDK